MRASRFVFDLTPLRVYWEVTRACDLACRHCRASAVNRRHPSELTTAEGLRLVQQLAAFGNPKPHLVLTGGDPLKRPDLWTLIAAARALGIPVSVAPSATPLLRAGAIRRLKAAGVEAISLSLDGSNAVRHDAVRGIPGTFQRTLAAARSARAVGLPFQVNTLVAAETIGDLPAIYLRLTDLGAARWSLFFLVSVGRGTELRAVTPAESEDLMIWLATLAARPGRAEPVVTTTEAPHFRRVMLQRRASRGPGHGAGIRDGNGVMFISHTGDVHPSGFLPVSAGNVRTASAVDLYRSSPLFIQLRDVARLDGKCGQCEFAALCGGSRARAYAATGNYLASDPLCPYQPRPWGAPVLKDASSGPHRGSVTSWGEV